MGNWEPTIGKWADYENYCIFDSQPQKVFSYIKKKYESVEAYWEYIDSSEKKRIPYLQYVQNILSILANEIYITSDYSMLMCTMARVREITDCSSNEIDSLGINYVLEELNEFPEKNTDNLIQYYTDVFNGNYKDTTMLILLAELIFHLRNERYPFPNLEEDIKYYSEINNMIDAYMSKCKIPRVCFLCEKIIEQLNINIELSRNRNS